MIDIHSHVIFGVDDGPKTLEESIELIKSSYSQGVRTIIATSHRRKGMFEKSEKEILENFNSLKNKLKEELPSLTILYGAEIYYTLDVVEKIKNGVYPTLANSRYVLVEFSSNVREKDIYIAINDLLLLGYIPIIAHIERYNICDDKKIVEKIINNGAYIQINASSVLKIKFFGDKEKIFKKRAKILLQEDLVHFIASDMHNLKSRSNKLYEASKIIEKKYGKNKMLELFEDNQRKVLADKII